tara:strand:+ start:757 stop:1149 length:393 start_codon:yes stop_codon:yes gene_type:complete
LADTTFAQMKRTCLIEGMGADSADTKMAVWFCLLCVRCNRVSNSLIKNCKKPHHRCGRGRCYLAGCPWLVAHDPGKYITELRVGTAGVSGFASVPDLESVLSKVHGIIRTDRRVFFANSRQLFFPSDLKL